MWGEGGGVAVDPNAPLLAGIRAPRFSGPGFPATVLRGKGAFPGARQHPPWCSRPPKVPVVRVLSSYKLGVRLGRVSLQLTRLGGDCPLPPISSLPQTSPGSPPATRGAIGSWGSAHIGALHDTATYPAAERDPAPSAAQQRPPPRVLAGTRGPCAPRATRPAWHKGSMAQPRPAASASWPRPRGSVASSPALLPPPSPARRSTGRNPEPRHGASNAVAASDRSLSPP